MKQVNFPEANFTWQGDGQEIGDLPVLRTGYAHYSCWSLTEEEVKEIVRTGCIWLGVMAQVHPPVLLSVEKPPEVVMEKHARNLSEEERMRTEQPQ